MGKNRITASVVDFVTPLSFAAGMAAGLAIGLFAIIMMG